MEINEKAPLIAQREIFIRAPIERVWKLQTTIDQWKDWHSEISASALEGNLEVGSIFKWKSGGLTIVSTLREIKPHETLAWTGKALGTTARHVWHFAMREGGTLVSTRESMEGWLIALLKPIMPGFPEKSLGVWLENLKGAAEK